ncbi:hypothetical protein EZV62_023933 [Acer yangbiense]|uniref:Uncharacterized protein n=1 Tax=Acer yangbiense TaxID=1000413 RepID=A0A5C7H3X9_9ROSI|nr:hypothetical protein EZV62_023933 [Acer yangbiense]
MPSDQHKLVTLTQGIFNPLFNSVSTTVISAFFASLERCACVYLTTFEPDDDEEESKDRPRSLRCQPPLRRRHR